MTNGNFIFNPAALFAFFCLIFSNAYAQNPQPKLSQAEQEVRKLEREWLDAYEKRDSDAMNRIVADEFKLTYSNGMVRTKADVIAEIKAGQSSGQTPPKFSTDEVQSSGEGDTVTLTGIFTQRSERGMMRARYKDVYVKRDGQWQVLSSQLTRISPQSNGNSNQSSSTVSSQPVVSSGAAQTIDEQTKEQLKIIASYLLEDIYVLPENGKKIAAQLRSKFESSAYKGITDPKLFAEAVTKDLREIGKDRHLYFRYDPTSVAAASDAILSMQEWDKRKSSMFSMQARPAQPNNAAGNNSPVAEQMRQSNYEFREVKKLGGNIGYLNLGGFVPGADARTAAAKAMENLAGSAALIIDLRQCPGGSADMVSFLASYFFDKEPRVLMTRYFRPTGETMQSRTVADLPGKRMTDTDLYILVSSKTGSACESFSYSLQQYGRAKIVGERTAGAGYNNALIPLGKGLVFSVSIGRPVHPISGKGWEGEGVKPDILVAADLALETAQNEALRKMKSKTSGSKLKN